MSSILVLKSSVLADASASNPLVDDIVSALVAQQPASKIVERDLAIEPIPHLNFDSAAVLRGTEPVNAAQTAALALSNTLIGELRSADTIVIGAPMYNFGITSALKSWFDHVLRAGVTFSYSEAGPEGLLRGKRAIVVLSRGGSYSDGPAQAMDSQEPHIRTLLNFIGIEDIVFVRAEKLGFGPDHRELSLADARRQIAELTTVPITQAA